MLFPVAFISRIFTKKKNKLIEENSDDELLEDSKFFHEIHDAMAYSRAPSSIERNNFSSDTVFDASALRNPFEEKNALAEEEQEKEELAKDTDFVTKAMNESHETLDRLVRLKNKIKINFKITKL